MSLKNWEHDKNLINRISQSINAGNVHHAYIIEGDKNVNRTQFAKDFLKAIVCENEKGLGCGECLNCKKIENGNYEDLYIVSPDGESVKDQDILDLQRFLQKKPSITRNMAIIEDAESITERGQNRLLKTLEEPTEGTIIVLLTENEERLLDTVRSRCVLYKLRNNDIKLNEEYYEKAREVASQLNENDYFHMVLKTCDKIKTYEELSLFLDALEQYYRNCILQKEKGVFYNRNDLLRFIEYIEESKFRIEYNMNVKYVLRSMLLKIGG